MNAVTDLGTHNWVDRTGGQLTGAERRSLLRPLARTHAVNAVGRLSMLARLNSGLRAQVDPARLVPPSSALTRAAVEQAQRRLSPALLNHSYRTFAFGAALGALEGLTVDRELLFAAALLHDTGLPTSERNVDFTRNSARVARDVAEEVGLSSAATETMRTAITLHYSPARHAGTRPRGLPAVGRCGPGCGRPALLAAAPGRARLGAGTASPAGVQGRVRRRLPRRGGPRATRARAVPAPLRGFRPRHQALALPRLTALRSSSGPGQARRPVPSPEQPRPAAPHAIPVDPPG